MAKALSLQATVEIRIPQVPNFLHIILSDKEVPVDVADIQISDLRTLAKEWGEALVDHAMVRRKQRIEDATISKKT